MGVRYPSAVTNTFIGPLPANANSTIVLTTPPMLLTVDSPQVLLFFCADITAGTTVTRHIFSINRNNVVAVFAVNLVRQAVAGARDLMMGCYLDNAGLASSVFYSLAVQQFGATGAGTWNDGCLIAMLL